MIRKVKSQLYGEESTSMVIRRKFIPVEFLITKKGQYQTFKKKVPYQVKKVVGIIITHSAPDHMMLANRIFIGSAADTQINQKLVCGLNSDIISGERQCYQLEVKHSENLYYGQPKRLGYAALTLNGQYGKFKSPVELLVRDSWTDFKEEYLVWESNYSSLGKVELCMMPDAGDGHSDNDDDHDEDDD